MTPELIQRMKIGPAALFLGQDHLCCNLTSNPFIDLLKQRYPDHPGSSLSDFLPKLATEDRSAFLAWFHRRSAKIPISESLTTISEFAWNHVYTSAIDEVWVRAFSKNWRSLHSLFTENSFPQDIRDRHRLCATFLFGCVDKEDAESSVPCEEFELDSRRQIAVSLLRRLPDILTPRGILVIDGWNCANDWLHSADLYPVLKLLGPSQVILFSATQAHRTDGRLQRIESDGILSFEERPLAEIVEEAAASERISLGDPGAFLPSGRQITIDSELAFIPKDIFLQVEPFAVILDDNLIQPPRDYTENTDYFEYLRFLEQPVQLRNWAPYAHDFPFLRDFYFGLSEQVETFLTMPSSNRHPIVLHGETGTGKTVALATLAYQFAVKAQYPVVYIERSSRNLDSTDWRSLDRFLNWAEDAGAQAALIVWDGMKSVADYSQLWSRLADRGRKAVVVGSSYAIPTPRTPKTCIAADRLFNPQERTRFLQYLEKRAPEVARWTTEKAKRIDEAYMVALYRILPPVRPSIRGGVVEEFHTHQESILERIKDLPEEPSGFNTLAAALDAAGKLTLPSGSSGEDDSQDSWVATSSIHGETINTIQKLFALVMTAGRYGCRMPIELLLATLGQSVSAKLVEALKTNVLVWHEAANGDLFLEPRQSLEAQIYMESLFGGRAEPEAELIGEMIKAIPRPGSSIGAPNSVEFVLEILQRIGPNSNVSSHSKRFEHCLLVLAKALQYAREERSVIHPSLMLQEATFFREGVRSQSDAVLSDKIEMLEHAASVLEQALELHSTSQWQRSMISGELAACLGTIISSESTTASNERLRTLYVSAWDAYRKARSASQTNIHATVTLGWITRPLIENEVFDTDQRTEVTADLIAAFDEVDEVSMDFRQQEYYLRERAKVMEVLGKISLSNEAFERLREIGSKAGYFLRARSYFSELPDAAPTPDEEAGLSATLSYLEQHWEDVQSDLKCLNLYFTVWWRKRVGKRPFMDERQILPFDDGEWNRCHELVERLHRLGGSDARPSIKFFRALSKFHIGEADASHQEFRELANDNTLFVGGSRLRKLFVASKLNKALEFDGQVQHDLAENEVGRIWINEIRSSVAVVPRDFDRKQLRRGDSLTDFHVAFSFAGAIAQPAHFLRNR